MQLENIYKSTRFAMAIVPNSFRDFFQWGVRMKLCLSILGTLAIHYWKGQLVPKKIFFKISQQNIASLGNNWEQEKWWDRLWDADPTLAIPGWGNFSSPWISERWIWMNMDQGEKQHLIFPKIFENLLFRPISFWGFCWVVLQRMKFTALDGSSAAPLWPPRCHQSHHSLTRSLR